MQLKQIKVGKVYVSKTGTVGRCVKVGGTFPVTVELQGVSPWRCKMLLRPRDVEGEVLEHQVPPELRAELFPGGVP